MNTPIGIDKCLTFINCQLQPPDTRKPAPKGGLKYRSLTISRQAGSGAHTIGEHIAGLLQARSPKDSRSWTVFDRNLVEQVLDEHNLPKSLARFMPEDRISEVSDTMDELFGLHPPSWDLVHKTSETILHLAQLGHVIVIGRGANVITAKMEDVFHVRLVGSEEKRVDRASEFYELKPDTRQCRLCGPERSPVRHQCATRRQSKHNGGVLGAFDGLFVGWRATPNVRLNLMAGSPLETTTDSFTTDRQFVSLSANLSGWVEGLEISPFVIDQTYDGVSERRAVGSELRWFRPGSTVVGLFDYDIDYKALNMAMLLGNFELPGRWTLTGTLDHRKSPFLTTRNAMAADQLEKLCRIQPPEQFQVSLEGRRTHNDSIRGAGTYDRVLSFLEVLKEMKVDSGVMLTLTADNLAEVLPLARLMEKRTEAFNFSRLSQVGEGATLAQPTPQRFRSFLKRYIAYAEQSRLAGYKENLINLMLYESGQELFHGCTGFGCAVAFDGVVLLSDGEVHGCRKFPSLMGNLWEQSLEEIYFSDAGETFRRGMRACDGCSIRPVCGGCVAASPRPASGISDAVDPFCWRLWVA